MEKNSDFEKFNFNLSQKNKVTPRQLNRVDIMQLIRTNNISELNSILNDLSQEKFDENDYFDFTKDELKLIKNYQVLTQYMIYSINQLTRKSEQLKELTDNQIKVNEKSEQNLINKRNKIEEQKKLNNETNTVETITRATSNQNKIKGKKSNNFVNEKMIIKPDPNKSIFKAVPNSAFFNQGNQNNKDIVVMAKKKPAKINEINKNNNIIKEENNEKNEIINQNQEIKNEYKKDINKKKPKEELRYKNIFNNDDDNNFNKEINNNNKYENGEEDNIIINEESNNNINNIIDCDERPKQKNIYEKDNKYKKENVGNSNNNIIQKLLNQMDFLTKGQNSLEKMFNNIQLDTQEQIDNLNINYENLQIKTDKLNKDFDNFNLNVYKYIKYIKYIIIN